MRGRGGQRKRSRGNNGVVPARKKRAVEEKLPVSEEEEDSDSIEIVEEKVSAFELLMNSLPTPSKNRVKRSHTKKKEVTIVTEEMEEIERDSKVPAPKWKTIKTSDPEQLSGAISDDDNEVSVSVEDKDSEDEEDEEEADEGDEGEGEDNNEQSIGTNYTPDHFNLALSGEQMELILKQESAKYQKTQLVSALNDFLPKNSIATYSPACKEFDRSENDSIEPLPSTHRDQYKKMKKEVYQESISNVFVRNKLREAFQTAIGKRIKHISTHRKRLLSVHDEPYPLPGQKELHQIFCSLFPLFDQYYDVFYSLQTLFNPEMIRMAYMFHVVNHTSKMRSIVIKNSQRVTLLQKQEKQTMKDMKYCEREYYADHPKRGKKVPLALQNKLNVFEATLSEIQEKQAVLNDQIQDQGFTRPRTLILVPSQEIGGSLVEMIMALYPTTQVHHRKRFYEYFLPKDRDLEPHSLKKPDYNALFHGNTNDTFYICVKLAQRMMKLFADPYDSDIIIASPIGLRGMIDKKAEKRGRHDFLSSIEICILDLSDVFLMQNWNHLEFIFKHMNCLPELSRETDFSRVKPYFLEGWAKYYRQTIVLSQSITPEIQALFNRSCYNYKGKVRFHRTYDGSISKIVSQAPQKFDKISCSSLSELHDTRFNYFMQEIFPQLRSAVQQSHTLIYIPSYFDYVRIRNHFKQERYSFVSITEYTEDSEIARSRLSFFQGKTEYLLVTERFYFFRRYKIRGIKQLVFYAPPTYESFYEDFVNILDGSEGSSTLLYVQPFDQLTMQRIVGNKRYRKMVASPKNSHLLVSGK